MEPTARLSGSGRPALLSPSRSLRVIINRQPQRHGSACDAAGRLVRCLQMDSTLKDRIMTALSQVEDPQLRQDLVSLDMIAGLKASADVTELTLKLVSLRSAHRDSLEAAVRSALAELPGLGRLEVGFSGLLTDVQTEVLSGVKHVLSVGSGKGGVGKSTVAANLAAALALEGATVGMLDADIYGPSQSKMFGVEGRRLMADDDKRILPLRNHGVRVISIANLVEDGQALTWRGPILHGTLTQLLNQTTCGDLDYLIVDLPPGTGDVQLSLTQLVGVTGMVMVTTPQDMALVDVKRDYTMARKTHIPVLGVVENMSYYQLPDGSRDHIFGEGGAGAWAEQEKLPLLGQIPITRALRESGDSGTPLVVSHPDNPSAEELRRVARITAGQIGIQSLSHLPMA